MNNSYINENVLLIMCLKMYKFFFVVVIIIIIIIISKWLLINRISMYFRALDAYVSKECLDYPQFQTYLFIMDLILALFCSRIIFFQVFQCSGFEFDELL